MADWFVALSLPRKESSILYHARPMRRRRRLPIVRRSRQRRNKAMLDGSGTPTMPGPPSEPPMSRPRTGVRHQDVEIAR